MGHFGFLPVNRVQNRRERRTGDQENDLACRGAPPALHHEQSDPAGACGGGEKGGYCRSARRRRNRARVTGLCGGRADLVGGELAKTMLTVDLIRKYTGQNRAPCWAGMCPGSAHPTDPPGRGRSRGRRFPYARRLWGETSSGGETSAPESSRAAPAHCGPAEGRGGPHRGDPTAHVRKEDTGNTHRSAAHPGLPGRLCFRRRLMTFGYALPASSRVLSQSHREAG